MTTTETVPHLLTIDQLAEQLGITVRHVRRLIAERRVPYLKVGKLVRFDPAEIADWLDLSRHPQHDGHGCLPELPRGFRGHGAADRPAARLRMAE